jgi:hypothetical protein
MALGADKTEDQREATSIAEEARGLFEQWEAEEEAGYRVRSRGRSSSGR